MLSWQEYVLALRSCVGQFQHIIDAQKSRYSYVEMVERVIAGDHILCEFPSNNQLDISHLDAVLSGPTIEPPHGLDLLAPIENKIYEFPLLPRRPDGTCPSVIDWDHKSDGEAAKCERQALEVSSRLGDQISRINVTAQVPLVLRPD
jgi:hypothetical protein